MRLLQVQTFAALIHVCQNLCQIDRGIMLHNLNIRHIELDMTDAYRFILDILLVYLTRG